MHEPYKILHSNELRLVKNIIVSLLKRFTYYLNTHYLYIYYFLPAFLLGYIVVENYGNEHCKTVSFQRKEKRLKVEVIFKNIESVNKLKKIFEGILTGLHKLRIWTKTQLIKLPQRDFLQICKVIGCRPSN